jgi:glucose-1-phosphate thymidylyltransferase
MIGIILAGGNGTRLRPITNVTNKHLLPVYNKPMIYYPVEFHKSLGITEVLLTTGKEFGGEFTNLLGDGSRFGINLTYKVQEEALGIAHALGLAENIAKGHSMAVILGDNLFFLSNEETKSIRREVEEFARTPEGAVIFLKRVSDPERFGVAEVDENGRVMGIEEKPKNPKSNYAVTGLYLYDSTVFEKIRRLKPSGRGELELTDVNNAYLLEGKLKSHLLEGEWTDAGTFDSLHRANSLAKDIQRPSV